MLLYQAGISVRRFAPVFVESVEKWREKAKNVVAGREVSSFAGEIIQKQPPPHYTQMASVTEVILFIEAKFVLRAASRRRGR